MKKELIILFAICFVGITQSCKKKGCTDKNATNYNSKAKKNDGSCITEIIILTPPAEAEEINIGSEPLYYFKIDGNEQDSRDEQNVIQYNYSDNDDMESQLKYGSNSQIGLIIKRKGMTTPSSLTNAEIEAYFTPGIYDLNDFEIGGIKDNGQTFSTLYSSLDQSNSQIKIVESQSTTLNGQFAIKVYIEFNCNTAATSGNWTEKFITEGKIVTYFKV